VKKFLSLLLVLVMAVSMLGTVTFAEDMPATCTEAEAIIKITCEGDSTVYYFPKFTTKEVNWAMKNLLTGMRTITLLKDVTLDNADNGYESYYFNIKYALDDWGRKNYGALTFDLNGHTMTYEGTGNLFMCRRYGFTVKNGTINYTGTAENARAFITCGGTSGTVGYSNPPKPYQPVVNIENVKVYDNSTGKIPALFKINTYEFTANIKDCELYSVGGISLFQMSDQKSIGTSIFYDGDIKQVLNVENSTLVAGGEWAFRSLTTLKNNATVNLKDSTVLAAGEFKHKNCKVDFPAETVKTENQTVKLANGKDVTGTLYTYGQAEVAAPKVMAFTDVKEGDWFYSFVKEMFEAGIIAGQTETTFNPNGNLTYGAALKLLTVGVNGKDAGNSTSGHWATNYLNEAVAAGWTTIGADKLDAPVTREAFCQIAAKAKNLTEQPFANPFTDTADEAVLALNKAGVIAGMNETTFNPTGVLTRAQIAKIISLLIKL